MLVPPGSVSIGWWGGNQDGLPAGNVLASHCWLLLLLLLLSLPAAWLIHQWHLQQQQGLAVLSSHAENAKAAQGLRARLGDSVGAGGRQQARTRISGPGGWHLTSTVHPMSRGMTLRLFGSGYARRKEQGAAWRRDDQNTSHALPPPFPTTTTRTWVARQSPTSFAVSPVREKGSRLPRPTLGNGKDLERTASEYLGPTIPFHALDTT